MATVTSSGFITQPVVVSGETLIVVSGGAYQAVVSSGGTLVAGVQTDNTLTYVLSSGLDVVAAGGRSDDDIINSGAFMLVSGSGAYGDFTSVLSSGTLTVEAGGVDLGYVSSGGEVYVSSGGRLGLDLYAGGEVIVLSGGSAGVEDSGGSIFLFSGGSGGGDLSAGSFEYVYTGGSAFADVYSGATVEISGGSASGLFVDSSGTVIVSSGGVEMSSFVEGHEVISTGATATGTFVEYDGFQEVYSGGSTLSVTVEGGGQNVYASATAVDTQVENGTFVVTTGGTATGLVVSGAYAGAYAYAYEYGGTTTGTVLSAGGNDTLNSGLVLSETVADSGYAYVSGGVTSAVDVQSGGTLNLFSAGTVQDATVESAGVLQGAGTLAGMVLDDGTVTASGGTLDVTGTLTGTGALDVGAAGRLVVAGTATGVSVAFAAVPFGSSGGTVVASGALASATIGNFADRDAVDLPGLAYTTGGHATLAPGDTLTVSQGGNSATLTLSGDYSGSTFEIDPDGTGGVLVEEVTTGFTVSTQEQLNDAIETLNGQVRDGGYTITLASDIVEGQAGQPDGLWAFVLTSGVDVTIQGAGHTISGGGFAGGLAVLQGNVSLDDLTLSATVAQGQTGGGGGAGLGGGLFVGPDATVTVSGLSFLGDSAVGGAGAAPGIGGAGGNGSVLFAPVGGSGSDGSDGGPGEDGTDGTQAGIGVDSGSGGNGGDGAVGTPGGDGGNGGKGALGPIGGHGGDGGAGGAGGGGQDGTGSGVPGSDGGMGGNGNDAGDGGYLAGGGAGGDGGGGGYGGIGGSALTSGASPGPGGNASDGGNGAKGGDGGYGAGGGTGGNGGDGGYGGYGGADYYVGGGGGGASPGDGYGTNAIPPPTPPGAGYGAAAGGDGGSGGDGGDGGNGDFGGGGGGGGAGGDGGFPGGSNPYGTDGTGGNGGTAGVGGFGGGDGAPGTSGFDPSDPDGDSGSAGAGGGGLGAGGDIFVAGGGKLVLLGSTLSGGSVSGGMAGGDGATDGSAFGTGIFFEGDNTATVGAAPGQTLTVSDVITDMQGVGGTGALTLVVSGGGVVQFEATNTYNGGTVLSGGELDLLAPGAAGSGTITFAAGPGVTLGFDEADAPGNVISGLQAGNVIAVLDRTVAGVDPTPGHLTIDFTDGSDVVLDLIGTYTANEFTYSGSDVTVACYAHGTHILTEDGERPVEALTVGTRLRTASGALRPIRWIGRRSYAARFAARNEAVRPITVRAGALGAGLPGRDLTVSPRHALLINGVLVPACALLDGRRVVRPAPADVHYVHVELDSHDVILAEGAASETFVDDDSRFLFQSSKGTPVPGPIAHCAPRVESGPILQTIRARMRRVAHGGTGPDDRPGRNASNEPHPSARL